MGNNRQKQLTVSLVFYHLVFRMFVLWKLPILTTPLFSPQVVLITGASSGLGEALAHKFYMCGCRLILASRRRDELERVKNDLMKRLADIPTYAPIVLELDLSDFTNMEERMEAALSIFSHVDILINNGGISYRGDILSTNIDVDYKVMLVNYFGQIAITKGKFTLIS